MRPFREICILSAGVIAMASGQSGSSDPLSYFFDGKHGQVEVGGRCVGVEFHQSRPLPSRLSFYYPVANSIDLSTDYWKRYESLPMMAGVQVNGKAKRVLGREPWVYTLSPHAVTFERQESDLHFMMTYEFCLNEPAMIFSVKIKNTSRRPIDLSAYTHLRLSMRTCQTYARMDSAWTSYNVPQNAVVAQFDDPETRGAACFVRNLGARPAQWTTSADEIAADSGSSSWFASALKLQEQTFPSGRKGIPVAAFVYERTLAPGESLDIVQAVGSAAPEEVRGILDRLTTTWKNDVAAYDAFVRNKALRDATFQTGDAWLDRSAAWARAILAANAHYLDGDIVPMPCPAEYNFFFTHDALMTNLSAVNVDLPRVKKDLLYIASRAREGIIPHAYYWRDDGFKTEWCTPDNWNHLWFIIVSAGYLRHARDDSTAEMLYPLVTKSLEEILTQKRQDNVMHAFRPDWWDIGRVEGPRSYITILTIRALREYLFLSAQVDRQGEQLPVYERLADSLQASLEGALWDDGAKYLMNWNGTEKDAHYYMGSLLAPAFGLLSDGKSRDLVATAGRELVDPRIGVRCVSPPDFHTQEAIAFFKFSGNEAGQPYYYINGGVWPHNNAWYALALRNVGRVNDAVHFVKTTMTLDGVARSPNGIPAMYEYRYSDPASEDFGQIDKPSFLWAGGFYLYTLYRLCGVKENEWNVSFAGPLPESFGKSSYTLAFGRQKSVTVEGSGEYLRSCFVDGRSVPSLVLPLAAQSALKVDVAFGTPGAPYLEQINAVLHAAEFDSSTGKLTLQVSSFRGHRTVATVVSPTPPQRTVLDGKALMTAQTRPVAGGLYEMTLTFAGSEIAQVLEIGF